MFTRTGGEPAGDDSGVYEEAPPPGVLREVARCVWRSASEGPKRIVPDGCVDLVLGAGEVFVAGPDTTAWSSVTRPGEVLSGVRFRPGHAAAALGVAADELRDRRVPLGELWGRTVAERLLEGELPLVEAVLGRLADAPPPDAAVAELIARLEAGATRVGEAAAGLIARPNAGVRPAGFARQLDAGAGWADEAAAGFTARPNAGAHPVSEAAAESARRRETGASWADEAAAGMRPASEAAAESARRRETGASWADEAAAGAHPMSEAAAGPAGRWEAGASWADEAAAGVRPMSEAAAESVRRRETGASWADEAAAGRRPASEAAAGSALAGMRCDAGVGGSPADLVAARTEDPALSGAVSERRLRRRFVQAVGYGPATYLRISRFQRAVALAPRVAGLAALAAAAGYADQAHLSRDCRALTGLTPRRYFGGFSTVDIA
ncbi:helix-turn-helix domain-containing protein [Amycolatopsis rifamycinica]|uniref:helix-turn-helix domain-containing protein n=1 Tax=Amycolatopsis rifamycinica TaxID=287986 RepID=UPI00269D19BE|nr:helix-turn-helix domain-containing protein [Amycolatopsis rifamycinica]